jgi:hypothetical protein
VVGHQTACAELSVPFARSKSVRFSGCWMDQRAMAPRTSCSRPAKSCCLRACGGDCSGTKGRASSLLPQSHPLRANEWMTARETLELATFGGAHVLGRSDVGSLESGMCRLLLARSSHHRLRRCAARSRGCHALLRPAKRQVYGDQWQGHRARGRSRYAGHKACDRNPQPMRS